MYLILSGVSETSNTRTKSPSAAAVITSWSVKISSSIDVAFTLVSKRLGRPNPPNIILFLAPCPTGIGYLPHAIPLILAFVDAALIMLRLVAT